MRMFQSRYVHSSSIGDLVDAKELSYQYVAWRGGRDEILPLGALHAFLSSSAGMSVERRGRRIVGHGWILCVCVGEGSSLV